MDFDPMPGQSPKAGCTPAIVVMFLLVIAMGTGFLVLMWWVDRGMK